MKLFEIAIGNTTMRDRGGSSANTRLAYLLPEDAVESLRPILTPYGADPEWYFDALNFGRPPAPWAVVCLDKEYPLASHVRASRGSDSRIAFAPYSHVPMPIPSDFLPAVGVLVIMRKKGLENVAINSALFRLAWDTLQPCSTERQWLVLLDPPPAEWLAQMLGA